MAIYPAFFYGFTAHGHCFNKFIILPNHIFSLVI